MTNNQYMFYVMRAMHRCTSDDTHRKEIHRCVHFGKYLCIFNIFLIQRLHRDLGTQELLELEIIRLQEQLANFC